MELNDEKMDFDLIGRKAKLPKCVNCIYSKGAMCERFKMNKIELQEDGLDIFNCPYYKPNDNQKAVDALKEMGYDK